MAEQKPLQKHQRKIVNSLLVNTSQVKYGAQSLANEFINAGDERKYKLTMLISLMHDAEQLLLELQGDKDD